MTTDQQFYLQMVADLFTFLLTAIGLILTYLKANQSAVQAVVATQTAQAAVAVAVENSNKADTANDHLMEIKTTTNGSLHQVTADLKVALERIDGLQAMVTAQSEAKVVADEVADNLATGSVSAAVAETVVTLTEVARLEAEKGEPVPVKVVAPVPIPVTTKARKKNNR